MSGIETSPLDAASPAWLDSVLHSLPLSNSYCFALSGGLDSVSLLSFLAPGLRARGAALRAIHVHHGLSPNADAWARFCLDVCAPLQVSCAIHKVQVEPEGQGLEAAARKARYDVFRRELLPDEVLLQGHHQDDQAETVLLRLMRGASPEELTAIPSERTLGQGRLFRPWLGVPRKMLLEAAERAGLRWIEDESNQDQSLDRNYLRHTVLPALTQRWPSALGMLARVAAQARQQQQLLELLLAPDMDAVLQVTPFGSALRLEVLRNLEPRHRNALIRRWLQGFSIPQIPPSTLHRFEREVMGASNQSSPELRWGAHSVRAYRGLLFYVPVLESPDAEQVYAFELSDLPLRVEFRGWRVELNEGVSLNAAALAESDFSVICLAPPGRNFCVRSKRQKDALRLPSGQHQSMKQVFQDLGVPPWWRSGWPMLFAGGVLVCAGPGKVDSSFRHDSGLKSGASSLVISWSRIQV